MLDTPQVLDPEEQFARPDEKAIATAITITSQVGTNRNMVLQTYIPRDAKVGEYHTICDKLVSAANRQEAMLQLEEEEATLAIEEKTLKQFQEDYLKMPERAELAWAASGRKGPYRPNPTEIQQKVQAEGGIKKYQEAIADRKKRIAKYRMVIAKVE